MFVNLGENGWRAHHWRNFQRFLGVYVFGHFLALIAWAPEVFSQAGMLPEASLSPLFGLLPSPFLISDSPTMAVTVTAVAALCGLAIAFDYRPRIAAVLVWFLSACLLARNPLILNPALPHVGWTLLWFAAVPRARDHRWRLPPELFTAAWLVMGLTLSWSAATKLASVSWLDGSALHWVWNNPLARDTCLRLALISLPVWLVKTLTWGVLGLELVALPAALIPRIRPFVWWGMLVMHLGLLLTVDFADLSLGMIAVHLALYDPRWSLPLPAALLDPTLLPRRLRAACTGHR